MTEYTDDEKELIGATGWPTSEADATADALIVHGARLAVAMHAANDVLMRRAYALPKDDTERQPALRDYLDGITSMIAEAQVVLALVAVQENHGRDAADAVAQRLWEMTEDGGVLTELMWEALDDREINADAVFALAEKSAEPGDLS